MAVYRETPDELLEDKRGTYDILWDVQGSVGTMLMLEPQIVFSPSDLSTARRMYNSIPAKWKLEKGRTLSSLEYYGIKNRTITSNKTTGSLIHGATRLTER